MSFSKKMLTIAAVSALTAATAVPAMALENEFHGLFRVKGIVTNFQTSDAATTLKKDAPTLHFIEQRARLMYIAKANDDLKLVTHLEIDSSWGDNSYQNGQRGTGAAIGGDNINLETKNVYLDFKIPSTPIKAMVGLQGITDAYKGIFLTDDAAGAVLSGKAGAATITGAFFRLNDTGTSSPAGRGDVDLYIADGKFAVSKDLTVGGSYYLVRNDFSADKRDLHMFGVNAAAKFGPVAVDAFAAYQTGDTLYNAVKQDADAFAAQVAANVKLGPGALRVAGLYASGENNTGGTENSAFQNIVSRSGSPAAFASSASAYYAGDMLLLMRSKWATDSDKSIVGSTNNANQGLMFGAVGYDLNLSKKLSLIANVGTVRAAERNTASTAAGDHLGTEVNLQAYYKMYDNLTAGLQGAYVFVGDQKVTAASTNADDPYLAALVLNYTF